MAPVCVVEVSVVNNTGKKLSLKYNNLYSGFYQQPAPQFIGVGETAKIVHQGTAPKGSKVGIAYVDAAAQTPQWVFAWHVPLPDAEDTANKVYLEGGENATIDWKVIEAKLDESGDSVEGPNGSVKISSGCPVTVEVVLSTKKIYSSTELVTIVNKTSQPLQFKNPSLGRSGHVAAGQSSDDNAQGFIPFYTSNGRYEITYFNEKLKKNVLLQIKDVSEPIGYPWSTSFAQDDNSGTCQVEHIVAIPPSGDVKDESHFQIIFDDRGFFVYDVDADKTISACRFWPKSNA